MIKRQCKYCSHCKNIGRAEAQRMHNGRKYYYCNHEDAYRSKERVIGDYNNFIGYGDNSYESPLQLKTHPKWCPLEMEAGEQGNG